MLQRPSEARQLDSEINVDLLRPSNLIAEPPTRQTKGMALGPLVWPCNLLRTDH